MFENHPKFLSFLIEQKLVEKAKSENSNATFWVTFKNCERVEIFSRIFSEVFKIGLDIFPTTVVFCGIEGFGSGWPISDNQD